MGCFLSKHKQVQNNKQVQSNPINGSFNEKPTQPNNLPQSNNNVNNTNKLSNGKHRKKTYKKSDGSSDGSYSSYYDDYYDDYSSVNNKSAPHLTEREQEMVLIAKKNEKIIKNHEFDIGIAQVIDDEMHEQIKEELMERNPSHGNTWVHVNDYSTIETAIECHVNDTNKSSKICILNFADAFKPGGGYLNGRSPQEETLCRQTLLYPTLINESSMRMYDENRENSENALIHDTMIYSKDVYVIRDDSYERIDDPFKVNIISSAAVDNRNYVHNSKEIMERRIRKIINLAAYEKNDILILGAFGCGVFQNNPKDVSKIFRKILIEENMKDYFESVWIPCYKGKFILKTFKEGFTPRNRK